MVARNGEAVISYDAPDPGQVKGTGTGLVYGNKQKVKGKKKAFSAKLKNGVAVVKLGKFKADQLPVNSLAMYQVKAQMIFDRAGFK